MYSDLGFKLMTAVKRKENKMVAEKGPGSRDPKVFRAAFLEEPNLSTSVVSGYPVLV